LEESLFLRFGSSVWRGDWRACQRDCLLRLSIAFLLLLSFCKEYSQFINDKTGYDNET
jgi:hypothetical protein